MKKNLTVMKREKNLSKWLLIMLAVISMVFISISIVTANGFDSEGRIVANFGSPVIDGEIDEIWESAQVYSSQYISGDIETSAVFRTLWDDYAIYIICTRVQ